MDSRTVSDGIRQYKHENTAFSLLFWESIICSAFFGFHYNSWTVFGLVLIFFLFFSWYKPLAYLVSIAFSLCWGIIGVVIGLGILQSGLWATIFAVIAFFVALTVHFDGYRLR